MDSDSNSELVSLSPLTPLTPKERSLTSGDSIPRFSPLRGTGIEGSFLDLNPISGASQDVPCGCCDACRMNINTESSAKKVEAITSRSPPGYLGSTPAPSPKTSAGSRKSRSGRSQSGKTTDKLRKGGKRDGTPEKPTTPNTDIQEDDDQSTRKNIIVNDEILAMQIKHDDLQKLREPKPPSDQKKTPTQCSINVRKLKPASEWDVPKPKLIPVAKPAPPDAPLKPVDFASAAGPRFDANGQIIPHSILGTVEDFMSMAVKNGDMPPEMLNPEENQKGGLTVKYEKKKKPKFTFPKFESSEESNALKNWNAKMLERKKQQGYLSKLLNKPADQLVMNQSDTYRETQELRYIIDRTIPAVDYGKGYRVGSEFWKQQELIGDDLTGIHMTNTQTEKGYPPPYEHIGVPRVVLKEKGTEWGRPSNTVHKPWHMSPYLSERQKQLQPIMDELVSHKPDLMDLQIVGSSVDNLGDHLHQEANKENEVDPVPHQCKEGEENAEDENNLDPLRNHPDVQEAPVFGPSLKFAGQPVRWTGDSCSFQGQVGVEARVTFEAFADQRNMSYLEIINDGTTTIYYDWKSLPQTNPFDVLHAKVQRFYFNTTSGVILPGETLKVPFIFKSPNPGVFSEQWQFLTHPVVCGGAMLIVSLRGVALQQDKFKRQRKELEQYLASKQANQVVSHILWELVDGIRTPDRPSSPIDAYITEAEIFSRLNPDLFYDHGLVQKLKELHLELEERDLAAAAAEKERLTAEEAKNEEPSKTAEDTGEAKVVTEDEAEEEEPQPEPWNLCVSSLKERVMGIQEDEEKLQELLIRLNQSVIALSFPTFTPTQKHMYSYGYQVLTEVIDEFVGEALQLRSALGMPERDIDDIMEEPNSLHRRCSSAGVESVTSVASTGKSSNKDKPTSNRSGEKFVQQGTQSDSKKPAAKGGKGAEKKGKESKPPPKAPSQAQAKEAAKTGKVTTPGGKRPTTREKDRVTPASGSQSPTPPAITTGDPILEAKYKEKLYTQAYFLLGEMIDKMDAVFHDIRLHDGTGLALPALS